MQWWNELIRRIQFQLRGAQFDRDLQEEMRLHQELRAADRAADGLDPQAALRAARLQFGSSTLLTERSREAWGWTFLDRLGQDLKYGLRTLGTNPGFAATAVLSLALGIGANTAIFSLIDALLLRTLPVPDPQRLAQVVEEGGNPGLTNPMWEEIRDRQRGFAGTLAFDNDRFDLASGGERRYAEGLWVSGSYFRVLGVPAMRGRVFTEEDDRHGGGANGAVAVISYRFWQSYFQGAQDVVGKTLRLNRTVFQVIGVTPAWFTGLHADKSYDVAVPLGCLPIVRPDSDALTAREQWWIHVWARLAPGESMTAGVDRVRALSPEVMRATLPAELSSERADHHLSKRLGLEPAGQGISNTGKQYRTALFTLLGLVGLVLLIACANIANLLLSRAAARRREFSMRLAIGAGRARIVRQLMTESLLLAVLGAAGGLLLAYWGGPALAGFLSTSGNPVRVDLSPDLRTLAFTAGITILTAVLFGLIPALRATRVSASYSLAAEARRSRTGWGGARVGKALVVGQIALSLVLLVAAGLFLGTLRNLLTADTGFDRRNILLVNADIDDPGMGKLEQERLHRQTLARLGSLPGVTSAAASYLSPLGRSGWNGPSDPEGFVPQSRRDAMVFLNRVSEGYFRTMRAPLVAGREFTARDDLSAPKAIILNERAARRFFGQGNAIGRTIGLDRIGHRGVRDIYQVVGVVKDAKYNRIDEAPRQIAYLAITQDPEPWDGRTYEIRTAAPVAALIPAIRRAAGEVHRDLKLEFRELDTQVKESLLQPRLVALLAGVFGGLALLLAMIGLYGITAYGMARRQGEIGIRMALGAQRGAVIRMMLREVLVLVVAGSIAGIAVTLVGGRYVTSLLYGIQPNHPLHLAVAAGVLAAAALAAAYLPARRAARIDPMAALRQE